MVILNNFLRSCKSNIFLNRSGDWLYSICFSLKTRDWLIHPENLWTLKIGFFIYGESCSLEIGFFPSGVPLFTGDWFFSIRRSLCLFSTLLFHWILVWFYPGTLLINFYFPNFSGDCLGFFCPFQSPQDKGFVQSCYWYS